jgi:hypothetical protein
MQFLGRKQQKKNAMAFCVSGGASHSRSFDRVSRDETARNSAQDEHPQLAQDGSSVH